MQKIPHIHHRTVTLLLPPLFPTLHPNLLAATLPPLLPPQRKTRSSLQSPTKNCTVSLPLPSAWNLPHNPAPSFSFFRKMASMRAYGLIEKRGVKVTDIGKSLTYGATEEEKNEALKEAVLNIPLWKEFYRRYGANLPKADFWADLTKITALEAPDAKKIEEIVRKAYLDDSQYVKEEKKPKGDISGMEPRAQVNISMSTIEIHAGQFNQTIPWTEKGIELGKDFLELLRAQMPKPEKRKKEKEVTPE